MPDKQLQLGEDDTDIALKNAWVHVLDVLSKTINTPSFESWVKTSQPISFDGKVARIGTNSNFAKHWLETKHGKTIKDLLESQLDCKISLQFDMIASESQVAISTEALPKKPKQKEPEETLSQPLNRRYTFENFVVGPTNRLAHACAIAVSKSPGRTYNPLFIYGGAGLGKTHLLHAIGHYALENSPKTRVVYVSGETFTYHYITALREQKTSEFRKKYRSVDLWLVDDIQFLTGKERTEEEFFHTYNAIYDMGKQIILSSDRAPKELQLDKRLLSRFECGMLADIRPPDLETRIAILQAKAESEGFMLPEDVMLYLAELITTNIRQLEGALIKLHAYASLMNVDVTPSLAHEVLGDYFGENAVDVIDA